MTSTSYSPDYAQNNAMNESQGQAQNQYEQYAPSQNPSGTNQQPQGPQPAPSMAQTDYSGYGYGQVVPGQPGYGGYGAYPQAGGNDTSSQSAQKSANTLCPLVAGQQPQNNKNRNICICVCCSITVVVVIIVIVIIILLGLSVQCPTGQRFETEKYRCCHAFRDLDNLCNSDGSGCAEGAESTRCKVCPGNRCLRNDLTFSRRG